MSYFIQINIANFLMGAGVQSIKLANCFLTSSSYQTAFSCNKEYKLCEQACIRQPLLLASFGLVKC